MKLQLAIIALTLIININAEISYSIDTRKIDTPATGDTDEEFANNLKKQIQSAPQPDGYCTKKNPPFPLSNQSLCGSNRNIGWLFNFIFVDAEGAEYTIEFGTDFGLGAAIFIDNKFYFATKKDLWWSKNWSSDAVFRLTQKFTPGRHEILILGSEKCCDGQMDVRFKRADADFEEFTIDNLEKEIPKPAEKKNKTTEEGYDCTYEWNCQELKEIVNTPCNQATQNEYIDCVVDLIDKQLEECSVTAKEPAGYQVQNDDVGEVDECSESDKGSQDEQ